MKTYVLNLPEDTARLESFRAGYPACLPTCDVWAAKTAEEIEIPAWWQRSPRFASHRQNFIDLMTACVADDETYMIFEDDCLFSETFEDDYNAFLAEVPHDWEMLNLCVHHAQNAVFLPQQISARVLRPRYGYTTSAILVTPAGARKVKENLELPDWGCGHVTERQLALLYLDPYFRIYSPLTHFTGQRGGWSTLCQREREEFWFNRFRYIDLHGNLVDKE